MSNICDCPGGNCPPGCINGQVNCFDPRCYPNCKNCNNKTSSSNWIIITIILVLLGVLLVMSFVVGFDLYKKTIKAAEPKNIIVNKHIHSVKQPILISSPHEAAAPQVTRTVTTSQVPQLTTTSRVTRTISTPPQVARSIPQITKTISPPELTRTPPQFNAPQVTRSIPKFERTPEITPKIAQTFSEIGERGVENRVSYDGLNLTLDDIPKPSVSARETPCNSR